jgi:hypothetical protein
MTGPQHRHRRSLAPAILVAVAAVVTLVAASCLAACGSSASPSPTGAATAVRTAITAGVPKDESAEPPWNGRYVQVGVTAPTPGAMRPTDWRVFVNGKEPELDKPANILPYAPHAATVAFVFRTPYTDLGTYALRVVYAPQGAPRVERSWDYKW